MPVERQSERLATPLRPRDRHFIAAVACAVVIGGGAGAFAYAGNPPEPASRGCVVVTVASSLGGATLRNCGAAAKRLCRDEGKTNAGIAAACRRQGLRTEPARKRR
jgi:hypothetical protein